MGYCTENIAVEAQLKCEVGRQRICSLCWGFVGGFKKYLSKAV